MKLFIVSDNNHGLTLEGILLGFCNGQSVGYLFSQFIIIVIFGLAVSILVSYFRFKLQDKIGNSSVGVSLSLEPVLL